MTLGELFWSLRADRPTPCQPTEPAIIRIFSEMASSMSRWITRRSGDGAAPGGGWVAWSDRYGCAFPGVGEPSNH